MLTAVLELAPAYLCSSFSTSQGHSTIGIRPSLIRLHLAGKSFCLKAPAWGDPPRSTAVFCESNCRCRSLLIGIDNARTTSGLLSERGATIRSQRTQLRTRSSGQTAEYVNRD